MMEDYYKNTNTCSNCTPSINNKDDLFASLSALSIIPKPAVEADPNKITFYGNITMIYAEAKMGKSFTVGEAIKDSNGIFIDIDNNGDELHQHLKRNDVLPLHGDIAGQFLDPLLSYSGHEQFIIVIDSFANYAEELGYNINDTNDIVKLFKHIRKITDKGHAVILIHHETSNQQGTKMQGNKGALLAQVQIIYRLKNRGELVLERSRVSNATPYYSSKKTSAPSFISSGDNHAEIP